MNTAPPREPGVESALPAEVVVGSASRWFAYRRYPVFSGPWLRKRLLLFALIVAALAVVAALVGDAVLGRVGTAVPIATLVFTRFMLIGFAGPSLASWVRARADQRSPAPWQMVSAVVIGMLLAAAVSQFGLRPLERQLRAETTVSRVTARAPEAAQQRPPPLVLPGEGSSLVISGQLRPSPWLSAASLLADGALYFFLGGGLALFAWFGEQRRLEQHRHAQALAALRAEKQLADLRLGVLQSQVEPHFLFNTLAALRSLLRSDPARAEAMLDALVDYLRATIPKLRADAGSVDTSLAGQVELCRRYLELMQLRMGDRLQFRIDLPQALAPLSFPPLLLISLVENAIKHGLEPKAGVGTLELQASTDGDQLQVSVSDDGVGLKPGLGGGLGLANIRAQLATRFAGRAAFAIGHRASGPGVVASIRVPLTEVQA
jgi:two-component sensor histidine kinase